VSRFRERSEAWRRRDLLSRLDGHLLNYIPPDAFQVDHNKSLLNIAPEEVHHALQSPAGNETTGMIPPSNPPPMGGFGARRAAAEVCVERWLACPTRRVQKGYRASKQPSGVWNAVGAELLKFLGQLIGSGDACASTACQGGLELSLGCRGCAATDRQQPPLSPPVDSHVPCSRRS
jgi:hypothetical protein